MLATGVGFRPGATELLAEVRAAGIACALVSASYTSILEAITAQLPHSFDLVIGGDQVKNGKPHPEPYLTAASTSASPRSTASCSRFRFPAAMGRRGRALSSPAAIFDGPRRRISPG